MMRLILPIALALLAGCARSEPANSDPTQDADLAAAERSVTPPGPEEEQVTPGNWEASAQGQAQAVIFRAPNGAVQFSISCDLRGGLVMQRPGLIARGNLALMQLRTADVVRRLAVNAVTGGEPQVEARVSYNDPLIDALLRFSAPLEVRYEGIETLVLPPNPLVGDLVRTCQTSTAGAAPVEDVAAPPATAPPAAPAQNSTAGE